MRQRRRTGATTIITDNRRSNAVAAPVATAIHAMACMGIRLFLTIAGVCLLASTAGAQAEPFRPVDDAEVLAVVTPRQQNESSALAAARAALAVDPQNLELALALARAAIEEGREQANPRRYGEAQAALAPWWNVAKPPTEVRVLRAVIMQAFHEFPAALADLDDVLAGEPGNAQARLSRALVRLVSGDVLGATTDCQQLPLSAGRHVAMTCLARVAAMRGAGAKAYEKLVPLIEVDPSLTGAMRSFAISIAADLAIGLGLDPAAERYFKEAASGATVDIPLLAAYADYLLGNGRAAEALELLDGKGEADILLLRRAIAAKRLGDARLEDWSAILNERFAAAAASANRVHLREEARYQLEVLDNPKAALPLAEANWRVQKEVADARILLACAIASGEAGAAESVVNFVRQTGLRDSRLTPLLNQLRTVGAKS